MYQVNITSPNGTNRTVNISPAEIVSLSLNHPSVVATNQQPRTKASRSKRGNYVKLSKALHLLQPHVVQDNSEIHYPITGKLYQINVKEGEEKDIWDIIQYSTKRYSEDKKFQFMNEKWTKRSSTCNGSHECSEPGCQVTKPSDKRRITCHGTLNLQSPPLCTISLSTLKITGRIAIHSRLLQQHFEGKLDTFVLPKVELNLLKRVQGSYQDQEVHGTKVVLMLMPYLRVLHIDDEGILIHSQSFFQSVLAYNADYIVVELSMGPMIIAVYENIQRSVMVSRTRVDRMNAQSYKMSFMYFFLALERDCGIDLNVYLKLKGVLVDFSTAQATGFVECVTKLLGEEAESTAMNLLRVAMYIG